MSLNNFIKKVARLYDYFTGNRIKNGLNEFELTGHEKNEINYSRLKNLLSYASKNVEFYRKINDYQELRNYPIINKETIKNNYTDFISDSFQRKSLTPITTSGSTGAPFTFLFDKRKKFRRMLEVIYYNSWANYELGDKHLLNAVGTHKSWFKLLMQNEIITNPLYLDQNWLEKQRNILKNNDIKFYVGYASAIEHFSDYCQELGDEPADFNLKGIISCAESLKDNVRKTAEKVFGCPVLSRYSSLETGVISQECPEEKNHHLNTVGYHVELLSLDSADPVKPGETGRVIVTDLFSYGMPLIRYDIGDLAVKSDKTCDCGRSGPILKKIRGRLTDNLLNEDGKLVSWAAINVIIWPYNEIKEFRLIQNDRYDFELLLSTYEDKVLDNEIITKLKEVLGVNINIKVTYVDEIPSLKSGKRPYILNNYLKNGQKFKRSN